MTSAETGVRLFVSGTRLPGLLSCSDGSFPLTSNDGGCVGGKVRTDLLPLLLPAAPAWTLSLCDGLFPPGQVVSKDGYEAGALAWLHLTVYALNYMHCGKATPESVTPTEGTK